MENNANTRIVYKPVIDAAIELGGSGRGWELLMEYFNLIYGASDEIQSDDETIRLILKQNIESIKKCEARRVRYEVCRKNGMNGAKYGYLGGRPKKNETKEEYQLRRKNPNKTPIEDSVENPNKTPIEDSAKNPNKTPIENSTENPNRG